MQAGLIGILSRTYGPETAWQELDALLTRLQARRKERPLIADIPDAELKGFIREHLAGREQFYTQAHITVDADALDGERMASVIHMIGSGRVNP